MNQQQAEVLARIRQYLAFDLHVPTEKLAHASEALKRGGPLRLTFTGPPGPVVPPFETEPVEACDGVFPEEPLPPREFPVP